MLYDLYPKNRRLTAEEKASMKDLVSCNVSNKDLRLFIQEKSNKNMTSSDISELKQELSGKFNTSVLNSELLLTVNITLEKMIISVIFI